MCGSIKSHQYIHYKENIVKISKFEIGVGLGIGGRGARATEFSFCTHGHNFMREGVKFHAVAIALLPPFPHPLLYIVESIYVHFPQWTYDSYNCE